MPDLDEAIQRKLPEAEQLHREHPVLLAHVHMERIFSPTEIRYHQPDQDPPDRQVDIPKLRAGGVSQIWLSEGAPGEVCVEPEVLKKGSYGPNHQPSIRIVYTGSSQIQRILRGFDALRNLCREHSDDLEFVLSVEEAAQANKQGKIAVFPHTETLIMANDLAMLRSYHALGLRASGLVHCAPLDWIDSDHEQQTPGGLTDFGREVINEMNSLGIVIDVSHSSEKAVQDVLQESRDPIVASHSNVKQLTPIMRNLSDAVIRGIADSGGVVGIHASSAFSDIECLRGRKRNYGAAFQRRPELIQQIQTPGALEPFRFEAENRSGHEAPSDAVFPTAGLGKLLDHVDYMVNLSGIASVGIGTDLQFLEDTIEGFSSAAEIPNFTAGLLSRGYTRDDAAKIMGGNFIRVMKDVIGK